jgi:hypothetical protein
MTTIKTLTPPENGELVNTRDLALRALVTKCVADVAANAIRERRTELAEALTNGDRINVSAPDDAVTDLGHVLRTKPKGVAVVTDVAALTKWMTVNYPDRVQNVTTIPPSNLGKAIQILRECAPYILADVTTIMDWAESEILKCTVKAKAPCGPGGELDIPGVTYQPPGPGVITVRLSDDGPAEIERLWRAGRVDLTSGEVYELEAGPL